MYLRRTESKFRLCIRRFLTVRIPLEATQSEEDLPSPAELAEQADRILRSPGFSKSEVLRNLLSYLVRVHTERPSHHLKEHEIATAVLGRSDDFDPRLDSTVRVHTGRLRTKLSEYYSDAGASDPIRITIPKGAYHICCKHRDEAELMERVEVRPRRTLFVAAASGWAVALVALALAYGIWQANRAEPLPPAVRSFWKEFSNNTRDTVVVYSNPQFVGSATRGMKYAQANINAGPSEINDRYTGIGEAAALAQLTRLFDRLPAPMQVKRSQLLTWDEARVQNLVFIGGPDTNQPQRELPHLQQFGFKTVDEEPQRDKPAVISLHSRAGEPEYFFASGLPYTMDYAVIGLVPGLGAGHKALILAGTTTYGTQAAAEFLLQEDNVRGILTRLPQSGAPNLPFFEALIRVKVSGGVPVQPELVSVRLRE